MWETVWAIISFACWSGGLPLGAMLVYSDSILRLINETPEQKTERKTAAGSRIPPWIKLLIAAIAFCFLAAGAFLVYNNGNWNINPLPLSLWLASTVVFTFLIVLHFNPCSVCDINLIGLSVINITVGVIMTCYWFSVSLVVGLFGIVVCVCYAVWFIVCLLDHLACAPVLHTVCGDELPPADYRHVLPGSV